jgi:hypothetical protein
VTRDARLGANAVTERGITPRASAVRALAAGWRGFVRARLFENEEGVEIAMGWCCPWLCFPVSAVRGDDARRALERAARRSP